MAAAHAAVGGRPGWCVPCEPPSGLLGGRRPRDVREDRRPGHGHPGRAGRTARAARVRGPGGARRTRPAVPAAEVRAGRRARRVRQPGGRGVPPRTRQGRETRYGTLRGRRGARGARRRRVLRRAGTARPGRHLGVHGSSGHRLHGARAAAPGRRADRRAHRIAARTPPGAAFDPRAAHQQVRREGDRPRRGPQRRTGHPAHLRRLRGRAPRVRTEHRPDRPAHPHPRGRPLQPAHEPDRAPVAAHGRGAQGAPGARADQQPRLRSAPQLRVRPAAAAARRRAGPRRPGRAAQQAARHQAAPRPPARDLRVRQGAQQARARARDRRPRGQPHPHLAGGADLPVQQDPGERRPYDLDHRHAYR